MNELALILIQNAGNEAISSLSDTLSGYTVDAVQMVVAIVLILSALSLSLWALAKSGAGHQATQETAGERFDRALYEDQVMRDFERDSNR